MEYRTENNPQNEGRAVGKPTHQDGSVRSFHSPKAKGDGRCAAQKKDGSGRCRAATVKGKRFCIGHLRAHGNDS